MPSSVGGLVLLLLSFAVTFTIARVLGKRYRARRRQKDEEAARANETRQVRRARERKAGSS